MNFIFEPGKIVNSKYRLIKVLGEGGWGVIYLAEDIQKEQQVALKALALRDLQNWQQIKLFEKEALVLQQLNHPAIPKYLDYFTVDTTDNRYFYLAQQLAPDKSLAKWVKDGWRGTELEIKQIAEQLLDILVDLHSQNPPIIHRDLKPSNIIRQQNGKIYLVDFGAVKNTYYSTLVGNQTVAGTFGYIAPEQFRGKVTPSSDLYSLGATILYLLTHIYPAELSTNNGSFQFRSQVNISHDFAIWIETITEPEIEKRFDNAKQALRILKHKHKKTFKQKYFHYKNVLFCGLIITFGLSSLLNSYKWGILSRLGMIPKNICEPQVMSRYLKQGGDMRAWRNTIDSSFKIEEFCEIKERSRLKKYAK